MKKIIYTRPDGGLSVVTPVRNTAPRLETLTDEEIERRALEKLPPDAINPRLVDASAIPQDRTFRNAWTQIGSDVVHDMGKCRALHRTKLRELRKPRLEALDSAYLCADERADTTAKKQIAMQKQALRDVTADPAIDAAITPEALKAVMPEILK